MRAPLMPRTPPPISPAPSVEALVLDLKISADDWRDSAMEVARDDDEADVPRVNEMQGRAERLERLAAALPGIMADAELPPGESPQRNEVCEALTVGLMYCGQLASAAGERTVVDLCDMTHVRALARLLTTRDPNGEDGSLGDNTHLLWRRIGTALRSRL